MARIEKNGVDEPARKSELSARRVNELGRLAWATDLWRLALSCETMLRARSGWPGSGPPSRGRPEAVAGGV